MTEILQLLQGTPDTLVRVFIAIVRVAAPLLALVLLFRCIKPLLTFRREPEIWAWLCADDGKQYPLTHWENVVGSNKHCDVVLEKKGISKNHCVFTRYDDGSWTVADADSEEGVLINGEKHKIYPISPMDEITIGSMKLLLKPISKRQEQHMAQLRTKASSIADSLLNVALLSCLQLLSCLAFLMNGPAAAAQSVFLGYSGILILQWLLLLFYIVIRRTSFEVETLAFFLSTMGMAAIATINPDEAVKQLICLALGMVVFLAVGWSLRDLERAQKIRYIAAVAGVGFLVITLLFGTEIYGAKNWLTIGSFTVQPSEFSKVCFVFAGASAMDRLMKKRNLFLFIVYSVVICGCLALMNDFGTALVFFTAFLLIAFLRSGSVGTIALACTSLGFAGVVALKIAPHALDRFATWRHIWDDPWGGGWQQTRALMCMSAGGLLGLGAGNGLMHDNFAADSDVVIATISEEWGLIIALFCVISVIALGVFAVRSAAIGRSSFYTIGACTAAGILLMQAILNCLGTVDILPFTGVTFPFLSNGGSSMIASWGLLGFIKAADTRQNASFAVRLAKKGGGEDA